MKLKPFGAVSTAVLLVAPAAFAQNTTPSDQQNQSATQSQGAQTQGAQGQAPSTGAQANVMTGKVTAYTPNQSITIQESNGQSRQINLGANSQVSPEVKVGSRVKVSESTAGGQQMVRVEPTGKHHAAAQGGRLPQTASNYPLMGLLGLLSLGAAAGIRIANRKLA